MDYPTSQYVFFVCLRAFKMFSTENETRVARSFDFDITRTILDESARPKFNCRYILTVSYVYKNRCV